MTFLLPVFLMLFASCSSPQVQLRDKLDFHETRYIRYWGDQWRDRPLPERIFRAPDLLIKKLHIENDLYGFKERPIPADPSPEFYQVVKQAVSNLPEPVRRLASERIIGIYMVSGLGGTGFADTVYDGKGLEKYAVIVLDRDVLLGRKANEWATWKERSFFKSISGKEVRINVVIESAAQDTVLSAIRYILLHEMGHSLGMASGAHASWNRSAVVSDQYPFTKLSWRPAGNHVESKFEDTFPERASLRPYVFENASLTDRQASAVYRHLAHTNFPSIHAAIDTWEDFAESFVTYIHVVMENRPYEIHLQREGNPDAVYRSCWKESRCETKRDFMKRWFEDPTEPVKKR